MDFLRDRKGKLLISKGDLSGELSLTSFKFDKDDEGMEVKTKDGTHGQDYKLTYSKIHAGMTGLHQKMLYKYDFVINKD